VGLIGVTGSGGHDGQVAWAAGVDLGHEAAEPQHPAQQHRAVADCRAAPPVQLPFADAQLGSDVADPRPGLRQPPRCLRHQRIGWPGRGHPAHDLGQAAQRQLGWQ
jgi:hypothetical protein